MASASLLSQIRSLGIAIDVDSMDPQVAIQHGLFRDMTSNQAIVLQQAIKPESAPLLREAITYVRQQNQNDPESEEYVQDVMDVPSVLLAKAVYPHIEGKVFVQTSPSAAYDQGKIEKHALKYISLFESHDIPKSRVVIKIPATQYGLLACKNLQEQGVNTLATIVYSYFQAWVASQAKCSNISPYFNDLRAHFEPEIRKEYIDDPSKHYMYQIIQHITNGFKGSGMLLKPASFISVKEVVALASFRPDNITVYPTMLDELAKHPEIPLEQFNPVPLRGADAKDPPVNFFANGATELHKAWNLDGHLRNDVLDSLKIFEAFEKQLKEFIKTGRPPNAQVDIPRRPDPWP